MARIDWIEQRLQNWARWKLMRGSGKLGFSQSRPDGSPVVREPYAAAPVPTNDIEASETDDLVERLPGELRRTVEVWYAGEGGTREKLASLCCAESTLHARVDRAHRILADHLVAEQERRRRERERLSSK